MAIPAAGPDAELRIICSTLKDEADDVQFELSVWRLEKERLMNEIDQEIDLLDDLQRQFERAEDVERSVQDIDRQQQKIRDLKLKLETAINEQRKWQDRAAILERQMDANNVTSFCNMMAEEDFFIVIA